MPLTGPARQQRRRSPAQWHTGAPVRVGAVLVVAAATAGCGQNATTLHHEIVDQTVVGPAVTDQEIADTAVADQEKHVVAISYKYLPRARNVRLNDDSG